MAMRFINGLSQLVGELTDPPALKAGRYPQREGRTACFRGLGFNATCCGDTGRASSN